MKLATVKAGGKARFGVIVNGGFVDIQARLQGRCGDLRDLLFQGMLGEAESLCRGAPVDFALSEVEFLPVNPRLDARVFALGWAYRSHMVAKQATRSRIFRSYSASIRSPSFAMASH